MFPNISPNDSQLDWSGALQRLDERLRTRLTTLAQRARLVVIQDGDNVCIKEAVPVKCPVSHGLGAHGLQMTTPRPRARSCQRPICLMRLPLSAASCSGVILKKCEYPSWSLPWWNCQVIMNFIMGFFWLLYLRVELFDRLMIDSSALRSRVGTCCA